MAKSCFLYIFRGFCHANSGGMKMKQEEKKPITWEAADPKLPVVQSGRMENRKQH